METVTQSVLREFVEREVGVCVTREIEYILRMSWDDSNAPYSWDDVENFNGPDTDDWDIDLCREFLDDHGGDYPDPNPFEMDKEDLDEFAEENEIDWSDIVKYYEDGYISVQDKRLIVITVIDEGEAEGLDAWREAVRECAEENPPEIFEWWTVSNWLADKLYAKGECVIRNRFSPSLWGRQTTGQAIFLDGIIGEIKRNA